MLLKLHHCCVRACVCLRERKRESKAWRERMYSSQLVCLCFLIDNMATMSQCRPNSLCIFFCPFLRLSVCLSSALLWAFRRPSWVTVSPYATWNGVVWGTSKASRCGGFQDASQEAPVLIHTPTEAPHLCQSHLLEILLCIRLICIYNYITVTNIITMWINWVNVFFSGRTLLLCTLVELFCVDNRRARGNNLKWW